MATPSTPFCLPELDNTEAKLGFVKLDLLTVVITVCDTV
jgi:hypothetical protein